LGAVKPQPTALRLLALAQRRPLLVGVAGVVLELLLVALIGADDAIAGVRGIGGESAALLAVIGALLAGPLVGAAMAAAGWALFFPLIAHSDWWSIVALPLWVSVATAVGLLSSALLRLERQRIEAARDLQAAHALRTPVATIHGLVTVLTGESSDIPSQPLLRAIADETERLLEADVFTEAAARRARDRG
jgi:signal transduction histidine kinase